MNKPAMTIAASGAGALVIPLAAVRLRLDPLTALRLVILGAALGQLALYDLRERRIPNRIVLPAAAGCAALSLAAGAHPNTHFLIAAGLVGLLLTVSAAWPAALGMGDVKLALLLLCALGSLATTVLLLALVLNALIGVLLLIGRGRAALHIKLPFAPITAAGCVLALLL